jgi:hypothetical protein
MGETAVAVDLPRKLLFLAVGTHVSPNLMFHTLANRGARDGIFLHPIPRIGNLHVQ